MFISSCRWIATASVLCILGCAQQVTRHSPAQPALPVPENVPIALDINVFSSYLSQEGIANCAKDLPAALQCKNDGIGAADFLTALSSLNLFNSLSPSVSRHDYELLIGNQLTQATPNASFTGLRKSITEFSVEWRGVAIDSFSVEYWHANNAQVATEDINQIVLTWWQHVEQEKVFSANFLYASMGASDYNTLLTLPDAIDTFMLSQRYMYPDPFRGIIARYTHPEFEEAILDIAIYPILSVLTAPSEELVNAELKKAVDTANDVAKARAMAVTMQQLNTPFASELLPNRGVMAEMFAESENGESLFASIYVFQMEDKFVKFSTTFPARIGDPLVKAALPQLRVPPESELMKEIRRALK
ncbi:hypothetical protein [Alteromonas sp. AMM-1]|uniref:hypothetical protein n=1 Tax=Alteromonas sp. AMM-1 TaxID=3394233 RepID=UPI0039A7460D